MVFQVRFLCHFPSFLYRVRRFYLFQLMAMAIVVIPIFTPMLTIRQYLWDLLVLELASSMLVSDKPEKKPDGFILEVNIF